MAHGQRTAEAVWTGNLVEGEGIIQSVGSGAIGDLPITWAARTETPDGKTSPEELIAAAHAACYAMALSATLTRQGKPPERLHVTAACGFEKDDNGFRITSMNLSVRGRVPGLDQDAFAEAARKGEQGCPVSNALRAALRIELDARLE